MYLYLPKTSGLFGFSLLPIIFAVTVDKLFETETNKVATWDMHTNK